MAPIRGQSPPTSLQRVAMACSAAVMILGTLGLAGWFTGLRGLAAISRDYIPMASSTAWSFLFLGLVLVLHGSRRLKDRGRGLGLALVSLTTVFGFLNFLEYFIGVDLSCEEVWFPNVQQFGHVITNRMSPVTGGIMFLSGVSMFLILRPYHTIRNLPGVLGSLVAILGLIGTTGYLFGTPLLHGGEVIPMAVTTTIAFLLLGVGLTAAAGPESFPLRALAGPSVRARMLRVFLPLSVSIIIAQGWLHQIIPGLFGNPALTAALLALGFAGVMVLLVTVAGRAISYDLDCAAVARQQAEAEVKQGLDKLHRSLQGTVAVLASIVETKDPYTAGHQRRVAQLASAMARELGWSEDWVEGMQVQGLLHDLGKIAVPTEILSRPGKISQVEFNLIKSHPEGGYDILKGIEFPWPVAQTVLQHHERLNGSGYPAGLTAEKIIPEARVLAVADVVEAMSSHRPYRPGLGVETALEEITNHKGTLYDPEVVDACVRLFTEKGFAFDTSEQP